MPEPNEDRTPERAGAWKPAFLQALGEHGMVTAACKSVGVGRTTAYDARHADEAFATAWADIEELTTERMEAEAYRRAVEGVESDIFFKGEVVGTEREFSDTLLVFLLKARRPEVYRENIKVQHAGGIRLSVPVIDESKDRLLRVAALTSEIGVLPEVASGGNGHTNGSNGAEPHA